MSGVSAIHSCVAMRIGIVGTHWGRVHCGTFRRYGHEIAMLVGRDAEATRRAAEEERVALGTTDIDALEAIDVVVIATPAKSHAHFVRRFGHKIVLCEKPLFGLEMPEDAEALAGHPRLFVNYAFPFLENAAALRTRLRELGRLRNVDVTVEVNLDQRRPRERWLTEIAVHPLSFVVHLLGEVERTEAPAHCDLAFRSEHCVTEVRVGAAPEPGIDYRLRFVGTDGSAELEGAYRVGGAWSYAPLRINGHEVTSREDSIGRDVWYEANCRSVGAMLDVVEARCSIEDAKARGLFDGRAALALDRLLR